MSGEAVAAVAAAAVARILKEECTTVINRWSRPQTQTETQTQTLPDGKTLFVLVLQVHSTVGLTRPASPLSWVTVGEVYRVTIAIGNSRRCGPQNLCGPQQTTWYPGFGPPGLPTLQIPNLLPGGFPLVSGGFSLRDICLLYTSPSPRD